MSALVPVAILVLLAAAGLRVAREYQRAVVFRLGRCQGTRGPGLYYLVPGLETQRRLDLRTRTLTLEPQEAITKDSVTLRVDAVLWYRVHDPVAATIAVEDVEEAVMQLALTSMRNMIGQFALDEVLRERATINERLCDLVANAAGRWGLAVEAVEMKDVEIPEGMQRAMAREAEATREKRARLIKAEAELAAAVKLAEAAARISAQPAALELRRMQMVAEIGTEQPTHTVLVLPAERAT